MWPSSSRLTTTAVLTTCEVAAMYNSNGSSGMGGTNTGGQVRNSLSSSKACCASGVHWNLSCFFKSLYKGIARSPRWETKRLSAAMQPVSLCTSFSLVGEFILKMSLSFSGLTSMPRYDTMKPSNFPDGTPKTHFSGFNFHLKRLRLANVSDRSEERRVGKECR